jgi:hypothetical protein
MGLNHHFCSSRRNNNVVSDSLTVASSLQAACPRTYQGQAAVRWHLMIQRLVWSLELDTVLVIAYS